MIRRRRARETRPAPRPRTDAKTQVEHMKVVARMPTELSVEERNLLSVAYKNVIGSRRASWRVISSIEQKSETAKASLIVAYKKKIETELYDKCIEIVDTVKSKCLPLAADDESKAFF